ncbi:T-complex protein 11-like protein 2 isoform X2 [Hyla sarda]|nr:T-complex protein 11-like protein 2 isoform X2 [Hyla sarda]XP_056430607.1 T-complex protein 11-like protein 2 isoform X2 [Hyla sarda]XP_056430608.1 T-complex protein 11-like protein 2 isoform X2 [Hyla sarda]XP_056430609.1 T-complex protein 11-like protein 2 isoform X2 [Hyla sarda]XP_056430611.1 T-complex protein 11-like protein 2 isoform X2 [Hyla sarda]
MVKGAENFRSLWTEQKQSSNPNEKLDTKKLYQLYNDILQPLSLFSNRTNQIVPQKKDADEEQNHLIEKKINLKENVGHNVCNDEVYGPSVAPFMKDVCTVSADVLCDIIRRKLHEISTANVVSAEVRQVFEDVILSEVKVTWDNIPDVLCIGILTQSEKRRLHKRLIDHLMIVSEELFFYYLQKMENNKSHSVFSYEANLTRFKAQLLLDCSKFMNVFSAKHYLISEIKEIEDEQLLDVAFYDHEYSSKKKDQYKKCSPNFTIDYFIKLGRPEITVHKEKRETDLMQLANIKRLDIEKVHLLIPRQENNQFIKNMQCEAITTPCPFPHEVDYETENGSNHTEQRSLKKSVSCPNLRTGDLLAEELKITFKQGAAECPEIIGVAEAGEINGNPIKDDLRRLIEDSRLQMTYQREGSNTEDEIPPLIKAMAPGSTNGAKRQKIEDLLQVLNKSSEQPEKRKTERCVHPQPFTIDMQISNRPLVRKADAQASDRIFSHLTEIPKYPPLYNDFTSEIEASTVKKLDRNLNVGQELQEVYTELTKNISTDHLRFDQDLEFEPYATKVDISICAASSTLTKKSSQRVINKQLDSVGSKDKCESVVQHIPADKDASKLCNSWLVWWKSIVNSDDYMKYISTQDLDYLKVIYHLYNSDSENEEQAKIAEKIKREEQKRQRDKKIADLREQKQSYIPGMWNVNSVMLGGLGSEPPLQEVHCEITESTDIPTEIEPALSHDDMQKKLHFIWTVLHVPESQRLDMAIKYSSNEYRDRLQEAIKMWEKAITLIKRREKLLAELEMFEREASDPNRFFHIGYEGTSMARMEESRKRKKLHKQMAEIEPEIYKVLYIIKKKFNDTVSYKGRAYADKMKWDKTEMLYWLQQERRKTLMEMNLKKENTCEELEPIK